MNLNELKDKIKQYQYLEDTSIIDVSLASIIANRMQLGDPVWLIIIGASSGGKSQILRPLALSQPEFLHRVDDLTENTFLSGTRAKEGEQVSLLLRIGNLGIIVISDFTVIMSKAPETRATILSQLRMLYDGEMTKYSGNNSQPIRWPASGKGYLGILAGSTPTIYSHFEDVADMGERFVYWRMKEFDALKATKLALTRKVYGKDLDTILASFYDEYMKQVVTMIDKNKVILSPEVEERIIEVSMFAERVRTIAKMDWKGETISRVPVSAFPMRVALQLTSIAKGLGAIKLYETGKCEFDENDLSIIDWLGYSLANEEKRACLKILASVAFSQHLTTATIADQIGLDSKVVRVILQNLSAVGVLNRSAEDYSSNLTWWFKNEKDYEIVRRIEHITKTEVIENRELSHEEDYEAPSETEIAFENI